MIKSKRMRYAVRVARRVEKKNAHSILLGKPEGMRPLGREDVSGWTIFKWILGRMGWYRLD
jgi:hypothetical protein